ncbi:MAG: cupin domain-containing protein [Gammaproteobacteria bacterium]|nr:cupin domain-containing protein [Gammaproteobacteria bacterium]
MLKLPGNLYAEGFLARHWQQEPLFMPAALPRVRPAITRNELGWMATLDDVESRLVFTRRDEDRLRYRAETGPFEAGYLAALPARDWTLLVHDVEKHVPAMRKLFAHVPFIPDWRIDDLMVSFAAPGGGVGPHRDNYDVFLCQGIGQRDWHVTTDTVAEDPGASDDLALTEDFPGELYAVREGDVLYLPPGVAHWGTATRACMTYSIGMRAPQLSDLLTGLPDTEQVNPFYRDPDLRIEEAVPGYISSRSRERAARLVQGENLDAGQTAEALGRYVTQTKDWIRPDGASADEARELIDRLVAGGKLGVHGMARIAWDDSNVYVNGACRPRPFDDPGWLESICATRELDGARMAGGESQECGIWMLQMGAFDLPEEL